MFKNFDFGWFTTMPGILTAIGCLLILISIIILISSLFSKNKNKKGESVEENTAQSEMDAVTTEPTVAPVEVTPVATEPTVAPVEVTPITTEPTVAPVEVTPVTTEPTVAPVEVTPVTTEPTVAPVEVTPVTTEPTETSLGTIEIQPVSSSEPTTVYGGANPAEGTGITLKNENSENRTDEIESL